MKVQIKYVLEDMDRHGNVRVYFRKRGCGKIRLPTPVGSPEFWEAYRKADASSEAVPAIKQDGFQIPQLGSVRSLVVSYYGSDAYKLLSPRTQYVRRGILDRFCEEHGALPHKALLPRHLIKIRSDLLDTPETANALIKALRQVFKHGIEVDLCDRNPANDVKYLAGSPDGFHTWTTEEIARFEDRHPLGTKAYLALSLLLYTGQRRSDIVALGKRHVKNGWLAFKQFKNRNKKPIEVEIPIIPELQRALDAGPCGYDTFLETEFGKPFTANGFGNWFEKRCEEAGVPGRAHGLRKAAAARLAERGASEKEIMAVTGHTTSKEVLRYTAKAQKRILAGNAMARLTDPMCPTGTAQATGGSQTSGQPIDLQGLEKLLVPRGGIEPPTLRFSSSFFDVWVNELDDPNVSNTMLTLNGIARICLTHPPPFWMSDLPSKADIGRFPFMSA